MTIKQAITTDFFGEECLVVFEVFKNGNTVLTAIVKETGKPLAKIILYDRKKQNKTKRNRRKI